MTLRKNSFDNSTMRTPAMGKPHIALIDGKWRVSPWSRAKNKHHGSLAHLFVARLNNKRLIP